MLSETSKEHLHVEMTSDAAMLPHKLTVSGIGDLELSVFKARFEYRDAFFLDANLTAGLAAELETVVGAINDEIAAWQDEIAATQARLQASASASPGYHIYASSFAQNIDVMHEVSQDAKMRFDLPLNATVDFDRLLYINDKHQHEWTLGP